MKKEMIIIFILGMAIIIFGILLSSNSTSDDVKINKKNIETSDQDVENDSKNNSDEDQFKNFNSKKIPDNFAYEEYIKNFFNAEAFSIKEGDTIFLEDFFNIDSKFGQDEINRIKDIRNSKKEYIIDPVELYEMVENKDNIRKFYMKVFLNGEEKKVYFEGNMDNNKLILSKMIIWSKDGTKENELG
ncbi:MAG: hypothetical protein ABF289_05905 [Clostridiales bacterium]